MPVHHPIHHQDSAPACQSSPALSDEQRAAVEHDSGPLIVLAGPGTGKTRVITARVAHLVRERGAEPESVLAVTFTNKAAGELRERLATRMDPVLAGRVKSGTLHAFGMRMLRRFGDMLGLPGELEILDPAQQRRLARELIRANRLYRASIGRGIDHAVEHGLGVTKALADAGASPERALARTDEMLEALAGDGCPDALASRAELTIFRDGAELARLLGEACLTRGTPRFDDLIGWPVRLLRLHESVRSILRRDCKRVVVDEFQDLNATQIELLSWLCPPESNPDLCVVGDDDQSIYAFRGADERAFDRFASVWQGVRTLRLTVNHRSGAAVVGASNAIIERAGHRFDPDKRGVPAPDAPEPSSVELVRTGDIHTIAPVIAAMVRAQREADPGLDLSTIAVIARTGLELGRIAVELELAGVPFVSSVPEASRQDAGVKGVLDWAGLVVDPTRDWAARAVLTRRPFGCEASALGVLEQRYRAQRAMAEGVGAEGVGAEGVGAESGCGTHPGPFVAWAWRQASADGADQALESALKRGAAVERRLGEAAANATADAALMEIIRLTGVAHAVDLPARERAARVRALVALVRFARQRLARLDEPRDLRALLTYLDDLPDKEKSFAPSPEEVLDPGEPGDDGDRPGVRLLTAHAAKGLEFNTVYIPRLCGGHGFPQSRMDEERVPPGVLEPDPHGRNAKARHDDEERRVFFVALTRARRRAVLVSNLPKKPAGACFPFELRDAPGVSLVEHEEADVLPTDGADGLDAAESEAGSACDRQAVLASARRAARRDAAGELDDAERSDLVGDALGARLRASADRLAMISLVARAGKVPDWAVERGLGSEAAALVSRLQRAGPDEGTAFPGLRGPLTLSYSKLNAYTHCPRCYLVRHVLGLPDKPSTHMAMGQALHASLHLFMKRWTDADNAGEATPGWPELERQTRQSFLDAWPRSFELDTDQLEQALGQARGFWEVLHQPSAQVLRLETGFRLPFEQDGVAHAIKGRIDRIDMNPSGGVRIIDYKTGAPTKEKLFPKKNDLQMGIYAMSHIAEEGGENPTPGSTAEYWMLSTSERGVIALADLDLAKVRQQIETAVRGMTAGVWVKGNKCPGDCDFLNDSLPETGK